MKASTHAHNQTQTHQLPRSRYHPRLLCVVELGESLEAASRQVLAAQGRALLPKSLELRQLVAVVEAASRVVFLELPLFGLGYFVDTTELSLLLQEGKFFRLRLTEKFLEPRPQNLYRLEPVLEVDVGELQRGAGVLQLGVFVLECFGARLGLRLSGGGTSQRVSAYARIARARVLLTCVIRRSNSSRCAFSCFRHFLSYSRSFFRALLSRRVVSNGSLLSKSIS